MPRRRYFPDRALYRDHVLWTGEAKKSYGSKEEALEGCPLTQNVHCCRLCGRWHRHSISTPRKAPQSAEP